VSGFTTVILLILLIGSFIMFGLGLIGIYLGQLFEEVKNRPIFLVDENKSTQQNSD
jgi:dolichol-phosphate mannosyltransferase